MGLLVELNIDKRNPDYIKKSFSQHLY